MKFLVKNQDEKLKPNMQVPFDFIGNSPPFLCGFEILKGIGPALRSNFLTEKTPLIGITNILKQIQILGIVMASSYGLRGIIQLFLTFRCV
jgi:hypothetical protein